MHPFDPNQTFDQVLCTLRQAGGRVIWAGRTPIAGEAIHFLVLQRIFVIQIYERGPASEVLSFDVLTAIRGGAGEPGGIDAAKLGRELDAIVGADRAALAEQLGVPLPGSLPLPGRENIGAAAQALAEHVGIVPKPASDLGPAEAIENRAERSQPDLYTNTTAAEPRQRRRRAGAAALSST